MGNCYHCFAEEPEERGMSPAVKLSYPGATCPQVSVDLVPAFRIHWPRKLRIEWKPIWPKKVVWGEIDYVHVVTKTHPSGKITLLMHWYVSDL